MRPSVFSSTTKTLPRPGSLRARIALLSRRRAAGRRGEEPDAGRCRPAAEHGGDPADRGAGARLHAGGRAPASGRARGDHQLSARLGYGRLGCVRFYDGPRGQNLYRFGGYHRFRDRDGYPAVKPPWGTLNAIDLNTGEFVWRVTLGEYPELTARGIAITGTENYGGPVITAGGLLFIAATRDEKFGAFDKATGQLLWQTKLPFGGYATPSVYRVNGKQYVVIAAGGGKLETPSAVSTSRSHFPRPSRMAALDRSSALRRPAQSLSEKSKRC
ncbi:hypothetical protein BH23GEM7_BH23GEM7_29440 [soil metagenome]